MKEPFLPQAVIARKRDGEVLEKADIEQFVTALTQNRLSDAQVGAFAMAVFLKSMTTDECAALTLAMRDSGIVLEWDRDRLSGPIIDKHSTGGVGDCVSLMLAPMLAGCGAHVPMISGRGLGHTGGTLDKLSSIPGYDTEPETDRFRNVVEKIGCAIIGQTAQLAPADRRLYAVRDATATVTADPALARRLAESIVSVAGRAGLNTVAVITDMSQPLAPAIGNALEIEEAATYLTGVRRDPRLHEVVMTLGQELLLASSVVKDAKDGRRLLDTALDSGEAAERFEKMVAALGGPADLLTSFPRCLPTAPVVCAVDADEPGMIVSMDTRALGQTVVELGGGRTHPTDVIDPAVGIDHCARIGDTVDRGSVLCRVHARTQADAEHASQRVRAAFAVGMQPVQHAPLVREVLRAI
jgi:thymidine phosphorylase